MHGHAPTRRGFTLTELLVVIAIIAILVALTSVGVMRAMATARATRIKTELDQIDSAFKAFKEKYGAYPPCDLRNPNNNPQLRQFVAMAFPRYDLNELPADLGQTGLDTTNFRPDQAVFFWLRGFSSDPLHPFVTPRNEPIINGTPTTGTRLTLTPLFEFDTARLLAVNVPSGPTDPLPAYFPSGVRTTSDIGTFTFPTWQAGAPPIVYWDARHYQAAPANGMNEARSHQFNLGSAIYTGAGTAAPYWFDSNGNRRTNDTVDIDSGESWANPDSFQLIACGVDAKYGAESPADTARLYPTGERYDTSPAMADDDNATNFSSKARIGDDRP